MQHAQRMCGALSQARSAHARRGISDLPVPVLQTILKPASDAAGGGMTARAQLSLVCQCGPSTRVLMHNGPSSCCQQSACSLPVMC
jgi:hypothetical protein